MTQVTMALNSAALQVLISRLTGVAEEMGAVLRRLRSAPTSRSGPTARPALFTAGGEMLVQAEHIPVHLGSMPARVRAGSTPSGGGCGRATRWCSTTRSRAAPT